MIEYLHLIPEFPFKDFQPVLIQEKTDKTADFAKEHFNDRTCHYPLLKGLGLLLLLGLAVVTIIVTSPIGLYFIPFVVAGVVITLPHLKEYSKKLIGELALSFVRIVTGKENWMHEVLEVNSSKLYLGGIPLKNYDHVNDFKMKNIFEVVSLIESWELTSTTFGGTPVLLEEWETANILQTLIETPDYTPVSKEKLQVAVERIHAALESGKNVYVHCKAGRGRSATAIICYLLEHQRALIGLLPDSQIGPVEVDAAIRYLTNIRPQICPSMEAVLDYVKKLDPH